MISFEFTRRLFWIGAFAVGLLGMGAEAAAQAGATAAEEVTDPEREAEEETEEAGAVKQPSVSAEAEEKREVEVKAATDGASGVTTISSDPDLPPVSQRPPAVPDSSSDVHDGGNFMDVRLNLTLTNENVLVNPGETIPNIPGWRFGRPNSRGVLFFDNYDTRFTGYETLSHLVLYKHENRGHHELEGAFVMRINNLAEDRLDLTDAGTYLRYAYWFDADRNRPERISVTAFPTSANRFRLGYSYRLSWGGSGVYRRSDTAKPGIKIQYDGANGYAFVGAKSSVVLDSSTAEETAALGVLAGAGYDVNDMLRIEANAGLFDRGNNELQDVINEKVILFGASTQISLHKGMPVGRSIDFALYRNDPERIRQLFRRPIWEGGTSWLVAAEATVLGQTLKDPNVTGGTTTQLGFAGDVNARLKVGNVRYRLDLQARNLAFILHRTPSLPTYSQFPDEYEESPNLFAAVGADYRIPKSRVTTGLILGVDMPATLTNPTGVIVGIDGNGNEEGSTAVIRNEGDLEILPPGEKAFPQYAVKSITRLDLTASFATILDAYYSYDPNEARYRRDGPEDLRQRVFGQFHQLGFNVTLQARF